MPTVEIAHDERAVQSNAQMQLIARAQRGDGMAAEGLFNQHKGRVYAICLRMSRDSAEAEDLMQDAFLQMFRRIESFRGESAFSTWLHRLVVNVVLMKLRKRHYECVPLEDVTRAPEAARQEYRGEDAALAGCVDRIVLGRAISQLPPGYQRVLVLHDVEGYKHIEIAAITHCAVGTCKSQLHRARQKLRESLRRDYCTPCHTPLRRGLTSSLEHEETRASDCPARCRRAALRLAAS
ncbi:MAG: RNA polymerase sigma factor [Terriglobia bacterium]